MSCKYTLTRSRMKALFLWHKDKRADYEEILGNRARHGLKLDLEHIIYFDSPLWPALLSPTDSYPITSPSTISPISSTPAEPPACPRA